jgi:hypothetical protein
MPPGGSIKPTDAGSLADRWRGAKPGASYMEGVGGGSSEGRRGPLQLFLVFRNEIQKTAIESLDGIGPLA